MARPCRLKTRAKIMMPLADFEVMVKIEEAEAHTGEDCAQVDDDDNEDLIEDKEVAMEIPIEARFHKNVVSMYQRVLCFSLGTAAALHDNQGITTITDQ
jgi:hypothetical protein